MSGLFSKPMTLTHRTSTGVGLDGRPVYTSSTSTISAGYRHRQAVDSFDAGLVVLDEWTVYFPAGTVVDVGDTVVVDGATFEVVSSPFPQWNHRTGLAHHLEARLRKAVR